MTGTLLGRIPLKLKPYKKEYHILAFSPDLIFCTSLVFQRTVGAYSIILKFIEADFKHGYLAYFYMIHISFYLLCAL